MGLIDRLRNVGHRAGSVAHESFAKVRHGWEDAEGRLRQRMRIYPQRTKLWGTQAGEKGEPLSFHPDDQLLAAIAAEEPIEINRKERRAIVSVHGRDVHAEHLQRGKAA